MEEKNLIFQQYKLYSEQKESFITRSFAINRFYLCLAIILLVLENIFKAYKEEAIGSTSLPSG